MSAAGYALDEILVVLVLKRIKFTNNYNKTMQFLSFHSILKMSIGFLRDF